MSLLIPLFLIFAICISGGVILLKQHIGEFIPVCNMVIIVILFFSYIVDALKIGILLILCAAIVLIIICIIRLYLRKISFEHIRSNLDTPSILILGIALFIVYLMTRDNLVRVWDALRLWGAYPKSLFYTDRIQLGENSWLYPMEKSYIPGMPLFVYFFEKLGTSMFNESVIFWVYGYFVLSLFMPALIKLCWKDWWKFVFITVSIVGVPLAFYNSNNDSGNFYMSLFIDPVLGMMMAYILYLITREIYNTWFGTIQFSLALFTVVTMKESGILFALVGLIGSYVIEITVWRKRRKISNLKTKMFTAAIFSCIPYLLWRSIQLHYGLQKHSMNFKLTNLYDVEFIKTFIKYCLKVPVVVGNFVSVNPYLTVGLFLLILTLFGLFLIIVHQPKDRASVIIALGVCYFMIFSFLVGMYAICVNHYNKNIGGSFPRYVCSVLTGYLGFLAMLNISSCLFWKPIKAWMKGIIELEMLLCILIFPIRQPTAYVQPQVYEDANEIADVIVRCVEGDDVQNVYLVCDGYTDLPWTLLHNRVYYDLIGTNATIKNYVTEIMLSSDNATPDQNAKTLEEFKEELQAEYDYVYIVRENENLTSEFGEIFPENIGIKAGTLYKVIKDESDVYLIEAGGMQK